MRNNISFLISLLLLGESLVEGIIPRIPLPFLRLRGGSSTATMQKQKKQTQRSSIRKKRIGRQQGPPPPLILVANVKKGLDKVGGKIQTDATNIGKNIGREWSKLTKFVANIPKLRLRKKKRIRIKSSKLDEVCHTFSSVLRGNEVDTAQLLKACRAHLNFMKSGGSSLRLVAKDLESNVQKAEKVYKKSGKDGRCLSSLLQCERESGIHNGDELHEKSAAMGLLWIRRSLAFQLDLYSSLVHGQVHPREAAYNAYTKHLSPFHGWALRKVFPASLSQMPDRHVFMAKFGGISEEELNDEYDRMIAKKLKSLVSTWDPLIDSWKNEYERLGLEDIRRV